MNEKDWGMRLVRSVWVFYQKLIAPTLLLSLLFGLIGLGLTGEFLLETVGIPYILLGSLFHYFIYEMINSQEYYFYYNMGLSRRMLWLTTIILNLTVGMVLILL